MLKTQPLCTGTESNLRDRVLGEVEKKSFILLCFAKQRWTQWAHVSKTVCPNPGGFGEEFHGKGSRMGLLTRFKQGLQFFNPASGGLLWNEAP